MKITISSILLLLLFSLTVSAQNIYSIKGSVRDTAEKSPMRNTTIMVVSAKDSVLQKFTRAGADGSFTINGLAAGTFRLFLSYPGYANYSDAFILGPDKKEVDFGKIDMELKSKLLQDVIIKGQVREIKMKGDTTEFNAKAYVIQPNSKVEDLLKQLPGIQVDKDGKITAQGQAVQKVLLDGEEFFGDDPTLITKNIRGDMVDKVQLYDKKSDQAAFTGIDDGVKIKTLNIKLKEDKKNGYFGKVDGGIGTDGYYQGEGLYNKFTAKKKMAAYLTGANDGKSGLSWEDSQKYTDGSSDAGGDVLNYNNQGIPVSRMGGAHYDSKWDNDKQSINTNYKIGSLDVDGTINTLTQNNLPGSAINTNADQSFHKSVFRQKLDVTYQVKLDTTSNLKIAADGAYRHTINNNNYVTVEHRGTDTLLNNSNRTTTNDADQHIMNASAFYTKKLKKKGRTVSVLVSGLVDHTHGNFTLKSENDFYNSMGVLDSTQLVNQHKVSDNRHTQFNANATYTEPITKYWSAIVNYGLNLDDNTSNKQTYNQSVPGVYNVLVDSLSSYFKLNQVSNQLGAMLNYTKDKAVLNFGTRASDVSFTQIDEYTGDVYKRHFINWAPQAMYLYKFSQQESVRLNYNGNTTQPAISQIQPVKNNSDPLNLVIGNPGLKPSFSNNINVWYSSYKVISGQNLYFSAAYNNTLNPIVNNNVVSSAGITTSQASNLNNKVPHGFNVYGGFNRKIAGPDLNIGGNAGIYSNISYNLTDNALNTTNSTNYVARITLSKYTEKKYDMYVGLGPTYAINESSLENIKSDGPGFTSYGYFNFFLPAKIQISSDINYTYTGKTASFNQDFRQTLWNATLSKAFFKESNLKISVSGNDLLNQNIGFSRSASGGMITQTSYNTIRRYMMLSVSWDFNKMGGGVPAKN